MANRSKVMMRRSAEKFVEERTFVFGLSRAGTSSKYSIWRPFSCGPFFCVFGQTKRQTSSKSFIASFEVPFRIPCREMFVAQDSNSCQLALVSLRPHREPRSTWSGLREKDENTTSLLPSPDSIRFLAVFIYLLPSCKSLTPFYLFRSFTFSFLLSLSHFIPLPSKCPFFGLRSRGLLEVCQDIKGSIELSHSFRVRNELQFCRLCGRNQPVGSIIRPQ